MYYHFVANASNVVFNNLDISGFSASANVAKNTDGWDTYRSEYVTIQSSVINNGDDCVSFKPNSTNMVVQDLWCNGSHGISVGSLGQYVGEYDIVENILVTDISMHNASDGARIKVWPNSPSALSGDLQGGGGDGRVNNVTYSNFLLDNVGEWRNRVLALGGVLRLTFYRLRYWYVLSFSITKGTLVPPVALPTTQTPLEQVLTSSKRSPSATDSPT